MASNGLPVYAQVAGDVPIGPAAARKCQNCLYFRHLELIGHRSIGLRRPPKAKVDNPISCASKWPVLARPRLAGFARPMTIDEAAATGLSQLMPLVDPEWLKAQGKCKYRQQYDGQEAMDFRLHLVG